MFRSVLKKTSKYSKMSCLQSSNHMAWVQISLQLLGLRLKIVSIFFLNMNKIVFLKTNLYYLQNSYLQQSQNSLKTKTHPQEKVHTMFSVWFISYFRLLVFGILVTLKWLHYIIFVSNIFPNSHLIQKCIHNQQLFMKIGKNIQHKDDRMNSL